MEDGNVVFRRRDGTVIDRSPERREQGDDVIENLAQESLDLGFHIDGQTGLSRWDGTRPNFDMCIDAVVGLDEDDAEPSYESVEYGWVG